MLKIAWKLPKADVLDWHPAGSLTQNLFILVIPIHLSYETHLCFKL